jgi:uncharacterized protein YbjT (DUF2867 family)
MILITGATGLIGRHLVTKLMAEGRSIRCLLPEDRQSSVPWDVTAEHAPQIFTGTLMDEEVLFQAATGAYTIIHLENAQWWGRPRDLERVEIVGTRNLITAARSARVGRIITLSHLGAAPSSAFTLLRVKGRVENMLRGSGLAYTIIRSGLVFGPEDHFINHIAMMLKLNPAVFLMPGLGEVALHLIYIDDLVEALMRSLDVISVVDEVIEIGGAEYITLQDLLYTVMRVTGMHRYVISVPPYVLRGITSVYGALFRRTLMTQQWFDILASNRTSRLGALHEYFGIQPRRIEDTLLTYLPDRPLLLPGLRYMFRRRPRGF